MACIGAVRMARCSTSVGPRLSRQAGELCLARRLSTQPHDLVLLEHRDNVALITFNAPARLNSLTVDMSTALHSKLDSLDWAKTVGDRCLARKHPACNRRTSKWLRRAA